MNTRPDQLPQHEGNPIPWVVRYTGEAVLDPVAVGIREDGTLRVSYHDGKENRDQSGMLWRREGISRAGEPVFGDVNVYRQRACMTKVRCQVCGQKINERPIRWLMSKRQLQVRDDGSTLTTSPPTCENCVPLALELCPYLRHEHIIVRVEAFELWGALGDFAVVGTDKQTKHVPGFMLSYEKKRLIPHMIARQLVAKFTKFDIEAP